MEISEKGAALIKHFESCKLKAYKDSAGIPTVGWGATFYQDGSKVKMGDVLTQQQADELLAFHLKKFERKVSDKIERELLQHQFDAAVSFCFNAGTGYRTSSGQYKDYEIWERIDENREGMKAYWENLAVTAGGVKLNGLVRRRKAEVHLYLNDELKFF